MADVKFTNEDFKWVENHVSSFDRWIKRVIDFSGAGVCLVLLLPILVLIAVSILLTSTGPVFFLQKRIGLLGESFMICKFRTMVQDAESRGGYDTHEQDPRITRVGKFLRRWSLDELPQFWNVLCGEMSLVGPRPTLEYQVREYTPRQRRRLLIRPGITGLAQVSGRNALAWPERIELDIEYIENYAIGLDIKILLRTLILVFSKKGIYG